MAIAGRSRGPIRSYRDLEVWQLGMDLVVECYAVAKRLPKHELYGLASQVRRATVSVPANIAEGHGREHLGDYLRHLSVANGSLMELETELLVAMRLEYVTSDNVAGPLKMSAQLGRMLAGLTRSLRQKYLKTGT